MSTQQPQNVNGIAMFFIVGPIIASAVRIPMMLSNTESGFAIGSLIGWIIGSLVSIAIGIALLIRGPVRMPEPVRPDPEVQQQSAAKKRRWAGKAYRICIVAWIASALLMIPLAMAKSETMAIVFGVSVVTTFIIGLLAVIAGKALSEASQL